MADEHIMGVPLEDIEDEVLTVESDVMDLEVEDETDFAFELNPPKYETPQDIPEEVQAAEEDVTGENEPFQVVVASDEIKRIFQFLDKYGIDIEDLSPEEAITKYDKIQSLVTEQVQVLSRGAVSDMLDQLQAKYVPRGFKGEFVFYTVDRTTEVDRAKAMGWIPVVSEEANRESPTGASDNTVRVGDLMLMMKPEEEYAAMQIARERRHAARRARRVAEQKAPSQVSAGVDPMGSKLAAHPKHPLKPIEQLGG
jgi:hypothetical protein